MIDADETLRAAMSLDWDRTCATKGFVKLVVKVDDDANLSAAHTTMELEEVKEALVKRSQLIFAMFDYYATVGTSNDVCSIGFNAFKQWVGDCKLVIDGSQTCDDSHMDQLFIAVNASTVFTANAQQSGLSSGRAAARCLDRAEMLQCIVRIAIARYIHEGDEDDVSEAVERLCEDHIVAHLSPAARQDSNDFRCEHILPQDDEYSYNAINRVLLTFQPTLRTIFSEFSKSGTAVRPLLAYPEWYEMCRFLELLDQEFTEREARLCFVWSRMRVRDERSDLGRQKVKHLSFEDFLEAWLRLTTMKALPLDEDILEEGYTDAGRFFLRLRDDPAWYSAFCDNRAQKWDEPLPQPLEVRVKHLTMMVVRLVQSTLNLPNRFEANNITKRQMQRFRHDGGAKKEGWGRQYVAEADSPPRTPGSRSRSRSRTPSLSPSRRPSRHGSRIDTPLVNIRQGSS